MEITTMTMVVATAFALVLFDDVQLALGISQSLLFDVKRMNRENFPLLPSHKVKRAQEEVMFGNQQNKLTDNRNFGRPAKRDISVPPLPDIENDIEKEEFGKPLSYEPLPPVVYEPRYRDTYYDPGLYDIPYFEENRIDDENQKRGRHVDKRRNRAKRELQLDPEELLALLALWEAEQSRRQSKEQRQSVSPYAEYEPFNEEENAVDVNGETDEGTWLDGPITQSHRIKPRYFPPYHWVSPSNQQAKRYLKEIIMKRNSNHEE